MTHRSARTAALHTAYDTLTIEEALQKGIDLGYTVSGAKSWFSHWSKHAPKVTAAPVAAAPVVDKEAAKRDARNARRRAARAAKAKQAVTA